MPVLMGRIGSPAAACSSPADFDDMDSMVMVRQRSQSKFTGSCACLRPAPQHLRLGSRGSREASPLQVHAEVAAAGVAGGLLTGQAFLGAGQVARGDVAVELRLDGVFD